MSDNTKIIKTTAKLALILCLLFSFACSQDPYAEERSELRKVYNPSDPTNAYYQVPSGIPQYQQAPYQQRISYQQPQQVQQPYYQQQQPYIPPTYAVPASRYYSNPYAIPPSNAYQRYDADQYYVPPNYYQNIERQQPPIVKNIATDKY